MTDDASPENLRKFLESDDPAMVRMGIAMAKGAGVEVTVKDLEHFLKSEDGETIKMGFTFAEEAGVGDEAMEMLCEALGDENKDISSCAAKALGNIGDARAVEPLIHALEKSEEYDEALNQEIIFALGELGDKKAIETLCSKMEIEDWRGNYHWQSSLLEAVGKIGDPGATWFLIQALCGWYDGEKNSGFGAEDALMALKNIGEPAVGPVTSVLYGCGGNTFETRDSWEVLNESIGWFREVIGDKRTSSILLELLKEDVSGKKHKHADSFDGCPLCSSIQARACAAIGLGNMEHDSALEKLAEVQELILSESEEIDDEFDDFSVILPQDSATYLTLVLEAQGKIGDVQAIEQLVELLGDDEAHVRDAAEEALKKLGHEVE